MVAREGAGDGPQREVVKPARRGGQCASVAPWPPPPGGRRAAHQSTTDFYRIAYKTHPHDHIFTISAIFNQTPMYKVGYTPRQPFVSFPMSASPPRFLDLFGRDPARPAPLAEAVGPIFQNQPSRESEDQESAESGRDHGSNDRFRLFSAAP